MTPVTPAKLVYRLWRRRLFVSALVAALTWLAIWRGDLPLDPKLLAAAGLALSAYWVLHLLGAALAGLRLDTVEVGINRVIRQHYGPRVTLFVRWLPLRLRMEWLPGRSVRLVRLRLALPLTLPVIAFVAAYITLRYVPAVADRIDPDVRMVIIAASVLAVLALCFDLGLPHAISGTINRILFLRRTGGGAIADAVAPFLDRRFSVAFQRVCAALNTGDAELIRSTHAELLRLDPPEAQADMLAATVMLAIGDFLGALRAAHSSACMLDKLPHFVLAAKEAGLPIDVDFVETARQVPQLLFDANARIEDVFAAIAYVAAINGDVDSVIVWAEAALRLETAPGARADLMQVLAESYSARGRARDAEVMLARARRADPHCPRLPNVSRIVADHLAQERVTLAL